jgi:hypothetical protein
MEYDEAEELARYIRRQYPELMSSTEWRAYNAGMAELKASAAQERGSEELARVVRKRWGIQADPEVQAALADGYDVFLERVAGRLLTDPAIRAMVNRCPKCARIVKTPLARQCLWCKHVWRDNL